MDRLLVSTFQRVLVRERDGECWTLLDKDGPFMGLTWDEERLFVGARCWGTAGHDMLYVYDREFRFIEKQEIPTHNQIHQILYHDGLVYLLDTPWDRIVAWNPDTQQGAVVLALSHEENRHHLNSIWWCDGLFWVVGLHGDLWSYDEDWNPVSHTKLGFEAHNVYFERNRLFVGASKRESLMIDGELVNLTKHLGVTQDPGDLWHCYTRGMARGEYLYIGAAAVKDERTERAEGRCAVAVFDVRNGIEFLEGLTLEDTGAMHDLRVLGLDRAHSEVAW